MFDGLEKPFPNCLITASLMGEWTVLSHQQNQAATKQKQGKALDFMTCGTSRLEHCGRSHEGPIQTSGVCIHKYAWACISNFPHMKTGRRWCQPQLSPTQCPPPSMGTPLLLQHLAVTLVPAPAALNWQNGTKQSPWSWIKTQKPWGLEFQNDFMD